MVWIIGEYAERIDNADELLESFLEVRSSTVKSLDVQSKRERTHSQELFMQADNTLGPFESYILEVIHSSWLCCEFDLQGWASAFLLSV